MHQQKNWTVYGTNALMLVEMDEPTFQEMKFSPSSSNEGIRANLDMIYELRDGARIKREAVKRHMEMKHKSNVLTRQFKESDLVMQRSQMNAMDNNLLQNGLEDKEVIGNRAYR